MKKPDGTNPLMDALSMILGGANQDFLGDEFNNITPEKIEAQKRLAEEHAREYGHECSIWEQNLNTLGRPTSTCSKCESARVYVEPVYIDDEPPTEVTFTSMGVITQCAGSREALDERRRQWEHQRRSAAAKKPVHYIVEKTDTAGEVTTLFKGPFHKKATTIAAEAAVEDQESTVIIRVVPRT